MNEAMWLTCSLVAYCLMVTGGIFLIAADLIGIVTLETKEKENMRTYTVVFRRDADGTQDALTFEATDCGIDEGTYNFWIEGKDPNETVTVARCNADLVAYTTSVETQK